MLIERIGFGFCCGNCFTKIVFLCIFYTYLSCIDVLFMFSTYTNGWNGFLVEVNEVSCKTSFPWRSSPCSDEDPSEDTLSWTESVVCWQVSYFICKMGLCKIHVFYTSTLLDYALYIYTFIPNFYLVPTVTGSLRCGRDTANWRRIYSQWDLIRSKRFCLDANGCGADETLWANADVDV